MTAPAAHSDARPLGHPVLAAAAVVVALTLYLTWPQAINLSTRIIPHNDAYFSMWRLGWIAHALRVDPAHLFDANIFYPERRTLAYSDAMLLEGIVAAPLLWSGLSPVLVYNIMLLGGIALSGVAMFVLARHLTGDTGAALVSAAIFTLAPYRVEHYMHLELQWTMWMPLAFWAAHRAVRERSWRWGALCGVFAWLQLLSCVYYGVFLAMIVVVLAALIVAVEAAVSCFRDAARPRRSDCRGARHSVPAAVHRERPHAGPAEPRRRHPVQRPAPELRHGGSIFKQISQMII